MAFDPADIERVIKGFTPKPPAIQFLVATLEGGNVRAEITLQEGARAIRHSISVPDALRDALISALATATAEVAERSEAEQAARYFAAEVPKLTRLPEMAEPVEEAPDATRR